MQKKYKKKFPDMVGAADATPTTIDLSVGRPKHTESTAESSEPIPPEIAPTPSSPVITVEPTPVPTPAETTQQVNTPSVFEEKDDIHFRTSYPLQTISHEQRDMALDVFKQQIIDYGKEKPEIKISFSYINLKNHETMGINDLEPIVPGGTWALPVSLIYEEYCAAGTCSLIRVITYNGDQSAGHSSYIADNYTAGKQFSMRTILNLALAHNDSLALNYITSALGGNTAAWSKISAISSYINFTGSVIYTDYTGVQQQGNYRTSTYDLANYMKYLYYGYINHPQTYQAMLNDLYYSEVPSPYNNIFGEIDVFHTSGRNESTHSYVDAAIIDGVEPFVVVISIEGSSYDEAQIAIADLSTYLNKYISSCHEPA